MPDTIEAPELKFKTPLTVALLNVVFPLRVRLLKTVALPLIEQLLGKTTVPFVAEKIPLFTKLVPIVNVILAELGLNVAPEFIVKLPFIAFARVLEFATSKVPLLITTLFG